MTPEQRREARERFKGVQKLNEEQKLEMRQRWVERQQGKAAPGKAP